MDLFFKLTPFLTVCEGGGITVVREYGHLTVVLVILGIFLNILGTSLAQCRNLSIFLVY